MKHLDFVDCIFRDQEVGGSNPLAPTNPFGVRRHGLHNVPDTWVTPFGVASAQLPSRTKVRRAALLLSVLCRIARIFPVPGGHAASKNSFYELRIAKFFGNDPGAPLSGKF